MHLTFKMKVKDESGSQDEMVQWQWIPRIRFPVNVYRILVSIIVFSQILSHYYMDMAANFELQQNSHLGNLSLLILIF